MASVTLPRPVSVPTPLRRRWPDRDWQRRALRLGLAAPLIALGWWAWHHGFASPAHRQVELQAERLVAGGPELAGLDQAYPPMPTLIAILVPGGTLGLSVAASLAAALLLFFTWERLYRRNFAWWMVLALLPPLFLVPAVAYFASQSIAGVASFSLLALALQRFMRFLAHRDTEAGFVTGLALGGAFLFDPMAVFYALALGLAAAPVALDRFRREPTAVPATVSVMIFPTLFLVVAWSFLEWRFTGHVFGTLVANPDFLAFRGGAGTAFVAAAHTVGAMLLHVPLYLAVALVYAVRRPIALIGLLVLLPGSVVAVWLGLRFTPVTAYVLFTVVALMAVPRNTGRFLQALLVAAAVTQLVLAWLWPPLSPGFLEWLPAVLP
jgi:hypothetical protein